jgi:hypothetical protein
MPLLSRHQTFALESCRDLLEKLHRELDRYREVTGRDEEDATALLDLVDRLKDSAFNAAVTAWHLGDWVFNDMTPEQREAFGFTKVRDLQDYVRGKCRALHLCRYAATASKHWEVSSHPDPSVKVIVECDDNDGWAAHFFDDEKKIRAEQVFGEAIGFWTEFIYQNRIAKSPDDIRMMPSG